MIATTTTTTTEQFAPHIHKNDDDKVGKTKDVANADEDDDDPNFILPHHPPGPGEGRVKNEEVEEGRARWKKLR